MINPRNFTKIKKGEKSKRQICLEFCLIIAGFALTISMIAGCASQSAERSYKDYKMSQDLTLERGKQLTPQEADFECSLIIKEVANLNKQIADAAGADSEEVRSKAYEELRWFQRRANYISCEHESLTSIAPAREENRDTAPTTSTTYRKPVQQPASDTVTGTQLTFDECFSKCKELTSRTNEVCFDTCLQR